LTINNLKLYIFYYCYAKTTLNFEVDDTKEQLQDEPAKQFRGRLKYRLEYDFQKSQVWKAVAALWPHSVVQVTFIQLYISVLQAEKLAVMDVSGTSDPFVKVCVMPGKKFKAQTKIAKKTLNPKFNETFKFAVRMFSVFSPIASGTLSQVHYNEVRSMSVVFYVYDFDLLSKSDLIGQVAVSLSGVDFGQVVERWAELEPPDGAEKVPLFGLHPHRWAIRVFRTADWATCACRCGSRLRRASCRS